MIDTWFKEDLDKFYDNKHQVVVFIDESADSEFLLKTLPAEYIIYRVNNDIEELQTKYNIEKSNTNTKKCLIYTQRPKDKLKFIREYCETNGYVPIKYLHNYIKEKVHKSLNLNINLPKEELISAAKVSIGKDKIYWMNLGHKGASEIFNLEKELLPFIDNPEQYEKEKYDEQLRETFYKKINDLLGQKYIKKPVKTLANEVVKAIFDGILIDKCESTLKDVYLNWLDSVTYQNSLFNYLDKYSFPSNFDIWSVNLAHPFRIIDEQWLKIIGTDLTNKEKLPFYLKKISKRDENKYSRVLKITFWEDVKMLLEFDSNDISYLSSFQECIKFYTQHFYKLDKAIRNLYTEFLNKKELLEPFQEHYKQLVSIFLDKWFKYFNEYKENQTGLLQRIIDESESKTAIIVGDGVTYDIACQIADNINGNFSMTRNFVIADIPSETENNMSRIYMKNGITEKIQSNREKFLLEENPDLSIDFIKLDDVCEETRASQILICTYKDIDEMGEKQQQEALKYFPKAINFFAKKTTILLKNGYSKVYLISDHGFVLTGLFNNSDKISVELVNESKKSERYIRTTEKQVALSNDYIEIKKTYKNFNYLYFSKNINPFKTTGVYGFSHGGVSPQELIVPYFCWERAKVVTTSLELFIDNKEDLKNVTGELFQIKIKSDKKDGDLFSRERKVFLIFYTGKTQINKSDVFIMQKNQIIKKEYDFDGNSEIEVQLLDAITKEQIDNAIIKQNKARDLGGLG